MQYNFVTTWQLKAPVEQVWNAIYLSEQWPQWWKSVLSVKEIKKGDDDGIGSVRVYKLRSPMLYTLSFNMLVTERKDHKLLKGEASGELEGTGSWSFSEQDGITTVSCYWNVTTTIAWMNVFGFILKPLFKLNHSIVMRKGGKDLAALLKVPILALS